MNVFIFKINENFKEKQSWINVVYTSQWYSAMLQTEGFCHFLRLIYFLKSSFKFKIQMMKESI